MLEPRDDLLDADRGDMQLGHVGREVGVALVGADDEAAGLRDREIGAGHAGVGGQDQRAGRLALRFGEVMDVAVVGVGADRLGEHLRHVRPQLVHRRHHDMARVFVVELLDAFAEIGLDHLDPDGRHVRAQAALFGQHRLALDQRSWRRGRAGCRGRCWLCSAASRAQCTWTPFAVRIGFELLEIFVEMRERVLLDGGGERAKFFPFGNAVHLAVALLPQVPEPLVVHLLVLGGGDEARGGFGLIDRPVAVDLRAPRLLLGRRAQRLRGRLGVIEAPAIAVNAIGDRRGPCNSG